MKTSRIIFLLVWLIVLSGLSGLAGCSAEKHTAARRNLMMPEKSDLPRNSKYKEAKKKKTYKPKSYQKKKS